MVQKQIPEKQIFKVSAPQGLTCILNVLLCLVVVLWQVGGRVNERMESAVHGVARKSVRSRNDNLARVSYAAKKSTGKR